MLKLADPHASYLDLSLFRLFKKYKTISADNRRPSRKYGWAVCAVKMVSSATHLMDYFLTSTSFTFKFTFTNYELVRVTSKKFKEKCEEHNFHPLSVDPIGWNVYRVVIRHDLLDGFKEHFKTEQDNDFDPCDVAERPKVAKAFMRECHTIPSRETQKVYLYHLCQVAIDEVCTLVFPGYPREVVKEWALHGPGNIIQRLFQWMKMTFGMNVQRVTYEMAYVREIRIREAVVKDVPRIALVKMGAFQHSPVFQMGRPGFGKFPNDTLDAYSLDTIDEFENNKTRIFVLDALYNPKEVEQIPKAVWEEGVGNTAIVGVISITGLDSRELSDQEKGGYLPSAQHSSTVTEKSRQAPIP